MSLTNDINAISDKVLALEQGWRREYRRRASGGEGGPPMRIDFNDYRQKKCQTCDKNAGRRKAKLTFGQRFCLATDAEISECARKGK